MTKRRYVIYRHGSNGANQSLIQVSPVSIVEASSIPVRSGAVSSCDSVKRDWLAQKAASGQQAHLSPAVESKKLLTFYSLE
jgi:hypothetical protein